MTAQVLFFDVFSEKDPHLNAVERVCFQSHVNVRKWCFLLNCFYFLNFPEYILEKICVKTLQGRKLTQNLFLLAIFSSILLSIFKFCWSYCYGI